MSPENLLQALFPVPRETAENEVTVVNIWTVEKGLDVVDVAMNQPCPALVAKCTEIAESAEWTARFNANQVLIQKLALAFGVPVAAVPDIALVFDVLRATKVSGVCARVSSRPTVCFQRLRAFASTALTTASMTQWSRRPLGSCGRSITTRQCTDWRRVSWRQ